MDSKIITTIKKIDKLIKSDDFKIDYIIENNIEELNILSKYLNVNHLEALFFSTIFSVNLEQHNSYLKDIGKKLQLDYYESIEYLDVIKGLVQKKLLKIKKSGLRNETSVSTTNYIISKPVFNAIVKNIECPTEQSKPIKTELDVAEYFAEFIDLLNQEEIELYDIKNNYTFLMEEFESFNLIQFCKSHNFTMTDTFLLMYVIHKYSEGKNGVELDIFNNVIFSDSRQKIKYIQTLISEENVLAKNNFVELVSNGFAQDYECYLTNKLNQVLKTFGIYFNITKNDFWTVKNPEEIFVKELILNPEEEKQVSVLDSILETSKFTELTQKMKKNGFQTGLNILFYGLPGTGKTESAYQIAKKCNRKILTVDISNLKSMWYGKTEKIIKRIFKDYAVFSESEENTPILFFNEADAIFSRRKDNVNSSVDQTENTIQNILLNELENFNGILIATTNLQGNLDKAFERRFLYKINFMLPNHNSRIKIWKLKFPHFEKQDLDYLGRNYHLSGAQIDNILRKTEIESLLFNKEFQFDDILEYCNQENLEKSNENKIGFYANKAS